MIRQVLPIMAVVPPLTYSLISLWCGWAFSARGKPASGHTPPVTIIKPVKGVDAESFANFASFCRQDYPCFQIIFAVASATDPVIPVIERLKEEFPDREIELVMDSRVHGPNYKVCNLINACSRAHHDIIVISDSDIRVGKHYLREICAFFADATVGLVTSPYRSSGVRGVATAVEAMGFTCEMIPNVMVALKFEGLSFALGASMAVRRTALEKIGGFLALVDFLADDFHLGNKIDQAGYRIELSEYLVESIVSREGLAEVLPRQLRWARTMRSCRPGGYFAFGLTHPFPAACLTLLLSGCSTVGMAAVLLLYAVRFLAVTFYSRSIVQDGIFPRWLWLLPGRDALSFVIWVLAFLGNRVRWRGHLFRLLPGGRIEELRERNSEEIKALWGLE